MKGRVRARPSGGAEIQEDAAIEEGNKLLKQSEDRLRKISQDQCLMAETPLEVLAAMEIAADDIAAALKRLEPLVPKKTPSATLRGGLTRQQGQFVAFIREFMMRNEAGVAPSHAEFQRFFDLTPPSVNSMLIRLEQRGYIRRVPGKARAIEITLKPECIPPLERPFRF